MAKKKNETCVCGSENFEMQTIVQVVGMDDQGPIPGPNSEMRFVCAACGAGLGNRDEVAEKKTGGGKKGK